MTILLTDISQPLFFFLYERTNEAKGLLYQVQSNCSLQQNKKFTLISYFIIKFGYNARSHWLKERTL